MDTVYIREELERALEQDHNGTKPLKTSIHEIIDWLEKEV